MKKGSVINLSLIMLLIGLSMVSCGDDYEVFDVEGQLEKDLQIITSYIDENSLDAYNINNTGVYIDIYHQGDEDTALHPNLDEEDDVANQYVTISYKGYLVNGETFTESGDSVLQSFPLSSQMTGLQIAMLEMTKGDSAIILIPSGYGVGNVAYNGIPANSVLIFDVFLESFELTTQFQRDTTIIINYLKNNKLEAYNIDNTGVYISFFNDDETDSLGHHPTNDSDTSSTVQYVTMGYKGYFTDGTIFDPSHGETTEFALKGVIPGWQIAIPEMSIGDSAIILVPSSWAYGEYGYLSIPGDAVLIFDVFLDSYERR